MVPQWKRALSHPKAMRRAVQSRPAITLSQAQGEEIPPPAHDGPWDLIHLPGGRVVIRVVVSDS